MNAREFGPIGLHVCLPLLHSTLAFRRGTGTTLAPPRTATCVGQRRSLPWRAQCPAAARYSASCAPSSFASWQHKCQVGDVMRASVADFQIVAEGV